MMKLNLSVFVLPAVLLMALPVRAAEPAAARPVNIEADVLEFQQESKVYLARGNAVVEQDGVTIKADQLTAAYTEGADGKTTFTQVKADGHVHIVTKNGEIFGDRGVYDVARQVAVLKGQELKMVTAKDQVTARDSLEFWQKEQLAVARGNAVASTDDKRIAADTLTAVMADNEQKQMEVRRVGAQGNVLVSSATEIARGDRGLYDVRRQLATLEGNVRITRGPNQLNGARAEMNMATGVSRLLAGGGQRVRGLVLPKNAPEVQ